MRRSPAHRFLLRAATLGSIGAVVGVVVALGLLGAGPAAADPAIAVATSGIADPQANEPVANDDEYTMAWNTVLVVPVATGILANDTGLPAGSTYSRVADANHNAANSFSSNGSFSYTPDAGFVGDDQYTYCITATFGDNVCLSNIATILIHVIGPPPAPIAADDIFYIYSDQTVNALGIFSNDSHVPAGASYKLLTLAAHVLASGFNADGSFTYAPLAGYVGDDSYTYCVTAGFGVGDCLSNVATILIHVQAPPPPTLLVDDSYSTPTGVTLVVAAPGVLINDLNLPDFDQVTLITAFAHSVDVTLYADGSLRYVPAAGFVGTDTARYCITDGSESSQCFTNLATITITVVAPPVPIVPTPPTVSTQPAPPVTANLAATGTSDVTPTVAGLLLALAGVLMVALSRPRSRRS